MNDYRNKEFQKELEELKKNASTVITISVHKKSMEYDKFKFFDDNRKISISHASIIINSILEIGYQTNKAILVDEDFYIIDGQHRFVACRELEIPILYDIVRGDRSKIMTNLNKTQSNWKLADYVNFHAKNNVSCYLKLVEYEARFGLGYTNIATILFDGKPATMKIREGKDLPINKKKDEILSFLYYSKRYLHFWKHARYIQAIVILFRKADNSDIDKIRKNISIILPQANCESYLAMLENILNKNRSKKIILASR